MSEPPKGMATGLSSAAQPSGGLDPARRAALLQLKLSVLVAGRWGGDSAGFGSWAGPGSSAGTYAARPFPGGAALRRGQVGWVLAEDGPEHALGPALVWATRAGLDRLHLLAAGPSAGALARLATYFDPSPSIWKVTGRQLSAAGSAPLPPGTPALAPEAAALAGVIRAGGADVVVEHGHLRAEVLGLEVGRVVPGPDPASPDWHLEVGVGRHDREATRMLRAGEDPQVTLARAVASVRRHRRPGASSHPANQLARARWLRAVLVARPALVGAAALVPVDPPRPATGVSEPGAAPAIGIDGDGAPVLVVCSTGVDPGLVPAAAEVRAIHARPDLRLVLALPQGDDHPVTGQLAARLASPAEIRLVGPDWPALGSPPASPGAPG